MALDKRNIVLYGSVLLSTLKQESFPSGVCYAAFMERGLSFDDYTTLVNGLKAIGLIFELSNKLTLTPKGRLIADKIDAAIAS